MSRKPSSPDPTGPKDPPDPTHVKQAASSAKIRRIIFGALAVLAIALFLGTSFQTKEIGAAAEQTAFDSGNQTEPSAVLTTDESAPITTSAETLPTPSPAPSPTPTPAPEIRAAITAVGDIIMHKSVIDGGMTNPGEPVPVYDYNADFQYVSSIFEESDLA